MTSSILNIGHNVNGAPCHSTADIVRAFTAAGMTLASLHLHESDSEMTSVIVSPNVDSEAVARLSALLGQDAIAVWHPTREGQPGELLGPNTEAWGGKFDPDFFLLPDGQRLGPLQRAFAA